jgi:hypothetical protein
MPVNKITLSEALKDYVTRRKRMGFSDHTIVNDRDNIGALVRHVERHKPIQVRHVTSDHVFDLFYGESGLHSYHPDRNGAMRKPINEATHNAYRKKIGQFNAYCVKRGWTRADWLDNVPTEAQPEVLRFSAHTEPTAAPGRLRRQPQGPDLPRRLREHRLPAIGTQATEDQGRRSGHRLDHGQHLQDEEDAPHPDHGRVRRRAAGGTVPEPEPEPQPEPKAVPDQPEPPSDLAQRRNRRRNRAGAGVRIST